MEERSNFELIIFYFKFRSKEIILFLIFSLIFVTVFFLYNLPIEPIVYGFLLCTFIELFLLE